MKVLKSDYPALSAWVEEQSLSLEEMETKVWKLPDLRGDYFIGLSDKKRLKSDIDLGFFYCPYIPKMVQLKQLGIDQDLEELSADKVVFKTDGQERMRIDADGNVGIGTFPVKRLPKKVFYIDVGDANQEQVKRYLDSIKDEIRQKPVPKRRTLSSR